MNTRAIVLAVACLIFAGCDDHFQRLWHGETLASGSTVKVTSFNLVWGIEHEDRDVSKDSFALEYVMADRSPDPAKREAEALQAFELIRPASELWGFRTASLAAYPTLERKGHYDLYLFTRQSDGQWSYSRADTKVFANDK